MAALRPFDRSEWTLVTRLDIRSTSKLPDNVLFHTKTRVKVRKNNVDGDLMEDRRTTETYVTSYPAKTEAGIIKSLTKKTTTEVVTGTQWENPDRRGGGAKRKDLLIETTVTKTEHYTTENLAAMTITHHHTTDTTYTELDEIYEYGYGEPVTPETLSRSVFSRESSSHTQTGRKWVQHKRAEANQTPTASPHGDAWPGE